VKKKKTGLTFSVGFFFLLTILWDLYVQALIEMAGLSVGVGQNYLYF